MKRNTIEASAPGALVLRDRHPVVSITFDQALDSPSTILVPLKEAFRTKLKAYTAGTQTVGEHFFAVATSRKGVRLVFSKKAAANLRSGKWKIPIDQATGLPRAELRDSASRIREGAKFEEIGGGVQAAIGGVVAVAHVISSIDTQIQLEKINEKLDRLSDFLHAEQLGELRGVYSSLQKAFADPDEDRRVRLLEAHSRKLDELQGRFFESAKSKLKAIRNPADIGAFEAMFSLQSTAESALRQDLHEALEDLRRREFCYHLNTMVHLELGQNAALSLHQSVLSSEYSSLSETLVEKTRYLDAGLADKLAAKIGAFAQARPTAELDLARGEMILSTGGTEDGE